MVADFQRETGIPAAVESAEDGRPADVFVSEEHSLTRALEGGQADPRRIRDLGVTRKDKSMVIATLSESGAARADARRLLERLASRGALAACAGLEATAATAAAGATPSGRYAVSIADWWVPGCSLERNAYNDPGDILGAPNAANVGGRDNFRGFMSLGQGGWVVVDMGQTVVNGPGPDVRVYQTTSSEPVSLYAGDSPLGPFTLVAFRRTCGSRSAGLFSNHCDFDLAEAGIAAARYLKIEDGELYPCLRGSTRSEGADIDAVELLTP